MVTVVGFHSIGTYYYLPCQTTTPIKFLENDSNLPSVANRLNWLVANDAQRLLALPDSNPTSRLARLALRRQPKKHRTPLHKIFASSIFDHIRATNPETIKPRPFPPWFNHPFSALLSASKEEAKELHNNIRYHGGSPDHNTLHLYSDGSMTQDEEKGDEVVKGGVSAGAFAPDTDEKRAINLGKPNHNTVHEAEMVGVGLALDLVKSHPPFQQFFRPNINQGRNTNDRREEVDDIASEEANTPKKIFIFLDSQSATQHLSDIPSRSPGQNIAIEVIKKADYLIKKLPTNSKITLCWIPGHSEIFGNEAVDEIANELSHFPAENPPYPRSLSSIRTETKAILRAPKSNSDSTQPIAPVLRGTDPASTFEALSNLPKAQCSALVQLRSGHSRLKDYLHRFKIVDSPLCDSCGEEPETADHFLVKCTSWNHHRRFLRKACLKLNERREIRY